MDARASFLRSGGSIAAAAAFLRAFMSFAGRKWIVALFFVMAGAVLESLGLFLLVPLLAVVFSSGSAGGKWQAMLNSLFRSAGVESALGRLVILLAIFACLMAMRAIVISARTVKLVELQSGFVVSEQMRVTRLLAAARWEQVVGLRHARVTHVMSGDMARVGLAAHVMLQGVTACVMLLFQCILAFLLSPPVALIAIALLIGGAFAILPMLRRAREIGKYLTDANLALLNTTAQFLGGLKLAISQNLQSRFVVEFGDTLDVLIRRQIDYTRQQTHSALALSTVTSLVGGALVLVGFTVFHTEAAVLTTLLIVIIRMMGPAGQIQQGAQNFAYSLPAYEKIKALETELAFSARSSMPDNAAIPLPDGPIVFEHVSFAHQDQDGGARGLSDVSLRIEPGEFVGIAGPSGAGKTTFADLLVGLVSPQSGAVAIGGVPLDGDLLPRLRASLSYVSQDPFLFHDTVRHNLDWARQSVSDTEIWDALKMAGAVAVVERMEHGLDTVVGERGTLISGGERQRIALARALLRRPKLLVLDEATSAIDPDGERAIIANLLKLNPRPTIVMIAHRAETLEHCDRIIRFENGRIVSPREHGA
jgi:ABC-type multidrug transport system fused ATPase/permease subunit